MSSKSMEQESMQRINQAFDILASPPREHRAIETQNQLMWAELSKTQNTINGMAQRIIERALDAREAVVADLKEARKNGTLNSKKSQDELDVLKEFRRAGFREEFDKARQKLKHENEILSQIKDIAGVNLDDLDSMRDALKTAQDAQIRVLKGMNVLTLKIKNIRGSGESSE